MPHPSYIAVEGAQRAALAALSERMLRLSHASNLRCGLTLARGLWHPRNIGSVPTSAWLGVRSRRALQVKGTRGEKRGVRGQSRGSKGASHQQRPRVRSV